MIEALKLASILFAETIHKTTDLEPFTMGSTLLVMRKPR